MRDLVIIGAGKFGREMLWYTELINQKTPTWNVLGFVDDTPEKQGKVIHGAPILGTCDWLLAQRREVWVTMPIGSSRGRRALVEKLSSNACIRFATIVTPDVLCPAGLTLGEGCILCPGTVITVDTDICAHVIVNVGSTISHDAVIDDFVTISPGVTICGNVHIGSCCEVGAGSTVIQQIHIAADTIIGAGATVVKDILCPGTYVGVPAKKITGEKADEA